MAWQGNGIGAAWARHAMCESAFSGLPLTAEALSQSQVICGGQSGRGTGLSLNTFLFSRYHFPSVPFSSQCCCYQKDKRVTPGNLLKSSSVS